MKQTFDGGEIPRGESRIQRSGGLSYYAMRPSTTVPSSPMARTVRGPAATAIMLEVTPISPLIRTQLFETLERRSRRACAEPAQALSLIHI